MVSETNSSLNVSKTSALLHVLKNIEVCHISHRTGRLDNLLYHWHFAFCLLTGLGHIMSPVQISSNSSNQTPLCVCHLISANISLCPSCFVDWVGGTAPVLQSLLSCSSLLCHQDFLNSSSPHLYPDISFGRESMRWKQFWISKETWKNRFQ